MLEDIEEGCGGYILEKDSANKQQNYSKAAYRRHGRSRKSVTYLALADRLGPAGYQMLENVAGH